MKDWSIRQQLAKQSGNTTANVLSTKFTCNVASSQEMAEWLFGAIPYGPIPANLETMFGSQ